MQYKFFVDGEWKHDEHQPYQSGEYGVVNTMLLATDPNFLPGNVSPGISSGTNMDVDNEAFRRLVRVSHSFLVSWKIAPLPIILGFLESGTDFKDVAVISSLPRFTLRNPDARFDLYA